MTPQSSASTLRLHTRPVDLRARQTLPDGAVGGGGLGSVAINYGYERFRPDIMLYTVVILIIMVQIFQSLGNFIYKITKK